MKAIVCAKQIPDPNTPGSLLAPDFWLDRSGQVILDPGDEYAVEAALRLTEANSGEVVALSMGPERAVDALRKALAMGAHKAILVSDESLRGADALTTATVLASAIKREDFDFVVTATESSDGYSGVVPQMLAELLDIPGLTFATRLEIEGNRARVRRQTDLGYEDVEAELPALISVTAGVNEPRYPTLKGIMGAKNKPIDRLTLDDLNVELPVVCQRITSCVAAESKAAGELVVGDDGAIAKILERLIAAKVI